jgi:dimethylargininase
VCLRAWRASQAGLPASQAKMQQLCDERGLRLHFTPHMTEIAKADGSLTCCSILF